MADRKATNKYYPPDWDPSKGSVNRYNKSHPLRHRARKVDEGILVVRFEMPFNIWCLKCDNHIGMGVRYNAEKSKVGNYYSTPIYKFRMKCHLCDNHFEIQTEPSKFDYIILGGARKQAHLTGERSDEGLNTSLTNDETKLRLEDAMHRLEKRVEEKIQSDSQLPNLHELARWRSRYEDHYSTNQLVRSQYRQKRKRIEQKKDRDKKMLKKMSLKISLAKTSKQDAILAKQMVEQSKSEKLSDLEIQKKKDILGSAILPVSTHLKVTSQISKFKLDPG